MKKEALWISAVATLIGMPVWAADMAVKAPSYKAPPPPVMTWTGCYVGANIGAGWQENKPRDPDPRYQNIDFGSGTDTGVVGGGQLGCDYQFAGTGFVVGIQGMFDGAGINDSFYFPKAYAGTTSQSYAFKTDWFGTLTGRIGYAIVPQALLYVKGGGAWVHTNYTNADPSGIAFPPFVGTASATRSGWLIGGGVEYAFSPNWSAFVEYNYVDLGTRNLSFFYTCTGGCNFTNPYTFQDKQILQTVIFGVNYRFGGPVVARY